MEKCRRIIEEHEEQFREFEYYFSLIELIENNIESMPDVAIECCSSLTAGISKTILDKAGVAYEEKGRKADSNSNLLKKALDYLEIDGDFEVEYVQMALSLSSRINEIRNERGDVSHGKSALRKIYSKTELAELIADVTDSCLYYMLQVFYATDWSFLDEVKYNDNVDFNRYLDEQYPDLDIKYSRGLYDQDYTRYTQELLEFNSDVDE